MAQVAPAAAAELLPCQRDSYLRTVQATVRSCREAKAALGSGGSGGKKKDKSKSKAPVQALFEVRARGPQNGGKTSRGAGLSAQRNSFRLCFSKCRRAPLLFFFLVGP